MTVRAPVQVVVAVGGNLADDVCALRRDLEAGVEQLAAVGFEVLRRSRWWRSQAWPNPDDPPFLNAVLLARTELKPEEALDALQALERRAGRQAGARNGPRPLDLDLITYGDLQLQTERLVLPHPRAAHRLFVVGPLAEIAPDYRWPDDGRTAAALAAHATVGLDARPEHAQLPEG